MIYSINEGLFGSFKKKPDQKDKERINRCVDYVQKLYMTHICRYESIVNKIFSKNDKVKKSYTFFHNPEIEYIRRVGGNEIISGCLLGIDIYDMNDDILSELSTLCNKCIVELNKYNKSKNIEFIHFWMDDDTIYFEAPMSTIERLIDTINESTIFESVEFI